MGDLEGFRKNRVVCCCFLCAPTPPGACTKKKEQSNERGGWLVLIFPIIFTLSLQLREIRRLLLLRFDLLCAPRPPARLHKKEEGKLRKGVLAGLDFSYVRILYNC